MNEPSCYHAIISLLKRKDGMSKESIVRQIPYRFNTVTKALTQLGQAKYVHQIKGVWFITDNGKDLPENFGLHFIARPANGTNHNFESRFLAPELIENNYLARTILRHANDFREWKEAEELLIPFVMLWLCANHLEPKLEFNSEMPEVDEELEAILKPLIKLAQSRFNR